MSDVAAAIGAGALFGAAVFAAALVRFAYDYRRRRLLLDAVPEGIFAVSANGRICYANAHAAAQFRCERRELLKRPIEDLVPEDARSTHVRARRGYLERPKLRPMASGIEVRALRRDGTTFPAAISLNHVRIGRRRQILCVVRDISEQHAVQRAMLDTNERLTRGLAEIQQRAADLAALTEMGELLQCCASEAELHRVVVDTACRIAPGSSGALYLSRRGQSVLHVASSWGCEWNHSTAVLEQHACWALRRGRLHRAGPGATIARCEHVPADSLFHHVCVPMVAHSDNLGVLAVSTPDEALARELADGYKRQVVQTLASQAALGLANLRLREQLRAESRSDPLTGLYNRRHFEDCMVRERLRAKRVGREFALLAIDIDRFKAINDRYGHAAGDDVLRAVGRTIRDCVRASDTAYRIGGEEFVVLLPDTDEHGALVVAESLRNAIAAASIAMPHGLRTTVTVSIGVAALHPSSPVPWRELVACADRALYAAKAAGRNTVVAVSTLQAAERRA